MCGGLNQPEVVGNDAPWPRGSGGATEPRLHVRPRFSSLAAPVCGALDLCSAQHAVVVTELRLWSRGNVAFPLGTEEFHTRVT